MSVLSGASLPSPAGSRQRRNWFFVVSLLAAIHMGLGVHCACRYSVTHDEYWHLPAGLAIWKLGRFDVDDLNPPLSRAWSALPLVALGASMGEPSAANDAFALGDHFLAANRDRYQQLYAAARIMNLVWSVLTGILIAVWGRELFGAAAGLVGAALWYLCPIVLSNAVLVTPDACAAFFFVATPFAAWRFAQKPTWKRGLVMGALLGLAQLAKFTDVLLMPVIVLVWFVVRVKSQLPPVTLRRASGQWIAALAVSLFAWNAGYLFRGSAQPLGAYKFASRTLRHLTELLAPIDGVPVPLPRDYLVGFDRQRSIMEGSHPVYLDGEWNLDGTGFRDYYLLALAYKWPHATQLIVLTALATCLLSRAGRRQWRTQLLLLAPSALVVGIASASGMQLGVRYVLPAFPLIYLFASQIGAWITWPRWTWRTAWVGVFLAGLSLGLRYHPHHLAYFNELSGGPVGGRNHLLDSNLDWGQDLRELRDYLHDTGIEKVSLAYFGMVPPAQLGINYRLPPSSTQIIAAGGVPPGWYAVSVNFVQGRPHTIRDADDRIRAAGGNEFGYFRGLTPTARIGGSIDVYQVAEPSRNRPAR
ncbi:MAG: phospholipid carrier-dependent glycosyltransferase [Planctomycetaceae bacterium]|nr:phospholipid carrier-dependent glycosyltransferase [Planctomycetaceae bacterium]